MKKLVIILIKEYNSGLCFPYRMLAPTIIKSYFVKSIFSDLSSDIVFDLKFYSSFSLI